MIEIVFADRTNNIHISPTMIVASPSEKSKSGTTKNVSFFPYVVIEETLCREDFTEKEATNYWFSKVELRTIREENRHIKALLNSGVGKPKDVHTRGLISFDNYKTVRRAVEHSREVVLYEQDKQRKQQQWLDPCQLSMTVINHQQGKIADTYGKSTQQSSLKAQRRGIKDELESQKVIKDDGDHLVAAGNDGDEHGSKKKDKKKKKRRSGSVLLLTLQLKARETQQAFMKKHVYKSKGMLSSSSSRRSDQVYPSTAARI